MVVSEIENLKSERQKIHFGKYIFFLIFGLVNLELIKCILKNMFRKYFEKNNPKVIFKKDNARRHLLRCMKKQS